MIKKTNAKSIFLEAAIKLKTKIHKAKADMMIESCKLFHNLNLIIKNAYIELNKVSTSCSQIISELSADKIPESDLKQKLLRVSPDQAEKIIKD